MRLVVFNGVVVLADLDHPRLVVSGIRVEHVNEGLETGEVVERVDGFGVDQHPEMVLISLLVPAAVVETDDELLKLVQEAFQQ